MKLASCSFDKPTTTFDSPMDCRHGIIQLVHDSCNTVLPLYVKLCYLVWIDAADSDVHSQLTHVNLGQQLAMDGYSLDCEWILGFLL